MGGHRNLEYAFWANEQAFGSSLLLLLGGLIGVIPYEGFSGTSVFFGFYWAAAYSLCSGSIVLLIEYPRGMRNKGTLTERKFQAPLAQFVNCLGPLTRNYYCRFVFYFLLALPSCCLTLTVLGGLGMIMASLIYLVAAIKGEQWKAPKSPVLTEETRAGAKYISDAPAHPPPRRPARPQDQGESSKPLASK